MTALIAPIVEGQTESTSLERILQRIWQEILQRPNRLSVIQPNRGTRTQLISNQSDDLARRIQQCQIQLQEKHRRQPDASRSILLMLDADDDCPVQIASQLRDRMQRIARPEVLCLCVIPHRMFENWIVAGSSTLGNISGLPENLPSIADVTDVDQLRGVDWLETQIRLHRRGGKYKKTVDAPVFVQRMSLSDCQQYSRSFRKLVSELAKIPVPEMLELPPASDDSDS